MKKTVNELIGDPLYQINLLLWMLQPSTGVPVSPLLRKAGYRLRDIEPSLPLPLELANKLQVDKLPFSDPASPELLLVSDNKEFVPIECKATMFGSKSAHEKDTSQIRQARSLLLQVPAILASSLGLQPKDVESTRLVYLSRHDPNIDQTEGLRELADGMKQLGYRTVLFGLLSLAVEGTSVTLRDASGSGALPPSILNQLTSGTAPLHPCEDPQTDPRPLYFLPWMPGSETNELYSQAAFGNRVLTAVAANLGPRKPPCDVDLSLDDLLRQATHNFYEKWRNKPVRKVLRENAKNLIKREIQRAFSAVALQQTDEPGGGLKFSLPDEATQSRILEGLRKWQTDNWNKPPEPGLFDSLEEN